MNNREQLEQQLRDLEAQKVTLFDSGSADPVAVGRLNEQIRGIQSQISALDTQETIIATAEEITSSMETFSVGDTTFTLEDLAIDTDCAKILRKGLEAISKKQAQKFLDELNNQKSTHDMHMTLKQEQVDNLLTERDQLQASNAQLQLERDDMTEKRDAAAQQLAEAQAEIARLNSHVDDLRKEIAVGSTNAVNVIDITTDADLEAAAQRLKQKKEQAQAEKQAALEAAKIPVYDVTEEYRTLVGTIKKFKLAENGEAGEIIWTDFNAKYRVMSEAEVERFRAELEAEKADIPDSTPEVSEILPSEVELVATIEPPTFRDEVQDADTTSGLGGDIVTSTGVQNHDGGTIEERLSALELAVFGQVRAA